MQRQHQWETGSNRRLLIGGELVEAVNGRSAAVEAPGFGTTVGEVALADADDVDRAVTAASVAFESWRFADVLTRRKALLDLASHLREDAEVLGYLDALDSGNPIRAMRSDVHLAATFIEYIAGLAFSWGGDTIPAMGRAIDMTLREPYGVTARIIPFNHPILFAAWKIAAPLLTGNTVVLKLPDQTPLSGLRLAEALVEMFPPGVVNVLTGTGDIVGAALVRHPQVARIAVIGSVATGKRILAAAAERVVPVTAELGGKNPMIVCPDVDVDAAMAAAVKGMNFSWSQGQSCGSYSRLFVHSSIYDEAIESLVAQVRQLRVRNPLDEDADMGSLVSEPARAKSEHYIGTAVEQGGRIVAGGARPTDPELSDGWYLEPTVIGDVTQEMTVAREEIFGPVQSVLRWEDLDDVIRSANATEYGLTANVWTNDINRAFHLAERIDSGSIAINGDGSQHWLGVPFGGFKASGLGKEESIAEVLESTRVKNIYMNLSSGPPS